MMNGLEERREVRETEVSSNSDYRHLIIETPKLQTIKHRVSSSVVTMFFWVFWLYLWQPVISIIAWALGFKLFYDNMISLGGIGGFIKLVGIYILVVFLIAFIFFGWAYYNNRRFRNAKRRGKIWKISFSNLGERYDLTEEQILNCMTSRRLVVHFDQSGKITALSNDIRRKS